MTSIFYLKCGLCPWGPPTQAYPLLSAASQGSPQHVDLHLKCFIAGRNLKLTMRGKNQYLI
jgi:hypothetical protein